MVATINSGKHLGMLKKGEIGWIAQFDDAQIAGKLLSMGILPGAKVEVISKAPFGGGFYIKADNITLALRKAEASSIVLK